MFIICMNISNDFRLHFLAAVSENAKRRKKATPKQDARAQRAQANRQLAQSTSNSGLLNGL